MLPGGFAAPWFGLFIAFAIRPGRSSDWLRCPCGGILPLLFTWRVVPPAGVERAKPVPPDVVCWSYVYLRAVLKQCPTLAPTFYRARVPSLCSALRALALSQAGAGSFGT